MMSVIDTERLILRPFDDSHIDALYAIQGDREHMRYTFWAESRDACAQWMRGYENRRAIDGFAPWVIVRQEDSRIVGWGGLNIDPHAPGWGVEVSYFIARECEGRDLRQSW
jgi:ribosomal-protein-alanine N-acetyltransferase